MSRGTVTSVLALTLASFAGPAASVAHADARPCAIGDLTGCGPGAFCAADWDDEGRCPSRGRCVRTLPGAPDLVLSLPFPAGTSIHCAKGPLRGGRSTHSACDPTTRFAFDLAAPADERPNFVLAPAGGVVRVFAGCSTADLNRQETPDNCNFGFGNVVRVEHRPGLYAQLAHLSSILVDDGARVRRGDVLGIEGNTGNAGAKHVHMSLHRGSARVALPGPTLPIDALRYRVGNGPTRVSSVAALPCGDFEQNPEPMAASRLTSENELARRPPRRFGFLRRIDRLAQDAVSPDPATRRRAMAGLRRIYDEPTAPYWLALAYITAKDTRTARDELEQSLRRAQRGEGPPWLYPWTLVFLGEIALAHHRGTAARDLFEMALNRQGAKDPALRARVRDGLRRINSP